MRKLMIIACALFLTACATSDSLSVIDVCPHQGCDVTAVHHHVY